MAPRDRLAARRKGRGHSQESLAHALGVTTSTVAHWEQGTSTPLARHRPPLAEHLEVSLGELDRLLDVNGHVAPDGHAVPAWLGHLASLEQGAAQLWSFEPVAVHGLLQTARYATAIESVGPDPSTADVVARKVDTRMARQGVLTREPDPLALSVVLDESVLHRVAGNADVMADQLDHLADVGARPNIDLRVLPLDAGVFSAAFGAFTLFTSPDTDGPYMACVEDRAGPHYLDRPHEIEAHTALFRYLADVAVSPADSLDLIHTAAQERYR
jgi:transcriptional regulator with XRE-family HTH domain